MEVQCIDVERIGEVVDLPAEDPRRRHADTCPRCHSLVATYLEFMKAEPVAGSGVEKVRAGLDAHIRAGAERFAPASTPASPLSRAAWWRGLFKPAPMLAGAAAVMLAAVFLWNTNQPEQSVLRDDSARSQPFTLQAAQVDSDGTIRLSWTAMPGADAYHVRIYGPDLNEVYRHPDTAETSVTIARSALPAELPPSLDLTWRVYALSGGDVVETSAPGSIRAP